MKLVKACALGFNFEYLEETLMRFTHTFQPVKINEVIKEIDPDDILKFAALYGLEKEAGYILAQTLIDQEFISEETHPNEFKFLKKAAEKDYIFFGYKDKIYPEELPLVNLVLMISYSHKTNLDDDYDKALKSSIEDYHQREVFDKELKEKVYQKILSSNY